MSLNIYNDTIPAAVLSVDGDFTDPFSVTMDGLVGGSTETRLYVRNDSTAYYYTGTTLTPEDTSGGSIVDGTDGFSWKLRAGNTQPTATEWADIEAGDPIQLNNIGSSGSPDISTYLPFWIRVEIPKNAATSTFTDVQLKINSTQNDV